MSKKAHLLAMIRQRFESAHTGAIMKTNLIAAALIAASTAVAIPAFASSYGPAPFYRPSVGAPASQRGPSTQTQAAESQQANENTSAYGGERDGNSQTGKRAGSPDNATWGSNSLYRHH
jgi:hypothetical protein